MKKVLIVLLLLGILLFLPLIQAQTYSGFDRSTDNFKLLFSFGDNKIIKNLEIREKEVNSAMENFKNGNEKDSGKNLEKAWKILQFLQEKVSLNTAEEINNSVNKIIILINGEENLSNEFEVYVLEEEKTGLTAEFTLKTFEYCEELSKKDFNLMLQEEKCNPETAPEQLKDDLEKLKDLQLRMFVQLMLEIRSCIDDPGTCNCENNLDVEQKAKCEKMVALAIRCEYKEDKNSCDELKSMEPVKGDGFAESFVPAFLMNLFGEKSYMVEYDINHSDGVPEECWDNNTKPECKQYDYLKETKEDWDEYGNYIGKRTKNKEPTMRESIPQCFDENDNFLEEKCGKITIIRNEEGLINYIIENEINNIIETFENSSKQNILVVNGSEGQNRINEIEIRIEGIDNEISNWVVENDVVSEEGDEGLIWEIKTEIAEGDNGLEPEIETSIQGDETEENEVVENSDENSVNYDSSITSAPGDTIDETYDDESIDNTGDCGDGVVCGGENNVVE